MKASTGTFSSTVVFSGAVTYGVDGTGVDATFYGDTAGSNLQWDMSDDRLEGNGLATVQIGTTTGINLAAAKTMIYGLYKGITTAVTGTGIGVRGNARVTVASAAGTLVGGHFQAGTGSSATGADGVNVLEINGVLAEAITAVATSAATVGKAVCVNAVADVNAATTAITSLFGARIALQSGALMGTVTNSCGLAIVNENVQGAGAAFGSAIIVGQISRAAGFAIGLDLAPSFADGGNGTIGASTYSTADIKLSAGATIANPSSDNHIKINVATDTGTIRLNSRNYAATSGDIIGFQSKPAANVDGTQTVYGAQISPRFNDGIAGASLVGFQVEPILKGATAAALSGDVRGLDVRLSDDGNAGHTVAGKTACIMCYNLLTSGTFTGGVYPIVVTANGSTQAWTALMEIPTALSGAADGGGALVYLPITINGTAARIAARYVS
jgi:hypothetical protein